MYSLLITFLQTRNILFTFKFCHKQSTAYNQIGYITLLQRVLRVVFICTCTTLTTAFFIQILLIYHLFYIRGTVFYYKQKNGTSLKYIFGWRIIFRTLLPLLHLSFGLADIALPAISLTNTANTVLYRYICIYNTTLQNIYNYISNIPTEFRFFIPTPMGLFFTEGAFDIYEQLMSRVMSRIECIVDLHFFKLIYTRLIISFLHFPIM